MASFSVLRLPQNWVARPLVLGVMGTLTLSTLLATTAFAAGNRRPPLPPTSGGAGGSRGEFCIIPAQLGEPTTPVWNSAPIVTVARVELGVQLSVRAMDDTVVWQTAIPHTETPTAYRLPDLKSGESYTLEVADGLTGDLIMQHPLTVLPMAEQAVIQADLTKLRTELVNAGASPSDLVLAEVSYFAEQALWVDALGKAVSAEESSPELDSYVQSFVEQVCH